MSITPRLLRQWGACWTDEEIKEAFAGRRSVTPRDVANASDVSDEDKLWVLYNVLWHLDRRATRLFAIESASMVTYLAGDEEDQAQCAGFLNDLIRTEDLPSEDGEAEVARAPIRLAVTSYALFCAATERVSAFAAWRAARDAAWGMSHKGAWGAVMNACTATAAGAIAGPAFDVAIQQSIARALEWLGDYADGWEEP